MRAPRTTGDVPAPHRRPSLLATRTDDDDEEKEGEVTTTARGLTVVMLGGPPLLLLRERSLLDPKSELRGKKGRRRFL